MRLVNGSGSEKTGACWMSALHWYTRKGKSWSDQPACVSPVIRDLCIKLNDTLPDGEREEVIGPHIFAPVGTNTGEADEEKRRALCADRALRVFAPYWLRKTKVPKLVEHAERLEAMEPLTTRGAAKKAVAILDKAHKDASASAYAYAYDYDYDYDYDPASAYAYAYASASAYASAYASMPSEDKEWFKREIIRLILDLCAVGRKDVEETKTRGEVLAMLS